MTRTRRGLPLHVFVVAFLLPIGCMQPSTGGWSATEDWVPGPREGDPGMKSNVVRVNKFFSVDPWLGFSADGSGKIDGVRCTLYLEGADKPKGVFGNGTIVVEMYRLDRDPHGHEVATPIYEWELPPDKAYPWRAKKETYMGWGYSLRLHWDKDFDVEGRQVAFVIRYIRDDGRVISSSRQVLLVPVRGSTPSSIG